jgi:uncharacterized protein YndB with AHSA1/START domain
VHAGSDDRRDLIGPAESANVTLPSDRSIVITRDFAAPRATVFDAWTRPEHVARWWDPRRRLLEACEIDLRPNGAFRFVQGGPESAARQFAGTYLEIAPPARLVFTTPGVAPGAQSLGTLVFDERGAGTRLTITIECASRADRDALLRLRIDVGTAQTLDNLAQYLQGETS